MYDVDGCLIRKIKLLRINDLALTRDGTVMVMVTQEKLIKVQRLVFDGKDVCCPPLPPFCIGCAAEGPWMLDCVGSGRFYRWHTWPTMPHAVLLEA